MKPYFFFLIFFVCVFTFSSAQNPLVKMWDKRFGGMMNETLTSIQSTSDGGIILGGFSFSDAGGDKTQNNWSIDTSDYWIVKTDSSGNKIWDKRLGGLDYENCNAVLQTSDKGYLIGGVSYSGISGDKSEPSWDTSSSYYYRGDYWIVKIDSSGNKQWDKRYGGTADDVLTCMLQTANGDYVLGGYSRSDNNGDKSQSLMGVWDFWVIRTDSFGNKIWDKTFGQANVERETSILQLSDLGFLLAGWGPNSNYWIVKVDSLGNYQWQRDYGGLSGDALFSTIQTPDRGFLLGGYSTSAIGGDKSEDNWDPTLNTADYWIIKIDSSGNKQWDKVFGGIDDEDEFGNLYLTSDGGYLIAGNSYSGISGNKTEYNLGYEQTWIVKTDSFGNLVWDKTIFTTSHDEGGYAIQTTDGCYVFANYTSGEIAGYKSQSPWNHSLDYWIVKFCDSTLFQPSALIDNPQFFCPGACTDFLNLSIHALSYQWNFPGGSPDTSTAVNPTNICYQNSGTYDVTLIASNANGSDTLTLQNYITVFPQPPAQSITQSSDTLFAIAGSSSYQWYFNGNIISGATTYFYVATASGDYNVVATDSNGCEVEAVINDVLAHTLLAVGHWPIAVYPNPVTSTIYIQGLKNNSADEIKIFNVFGEKVFSAVNCKLPIANCQFSSGLYYIEITSDKIIYRTKFIKQ